ncbi:MAG: hypothetical protein INE95_14855 [Phenylobacterium sp.]|nr:hypothetical protein [Phenylobacterium sp.]MCA3742224.1 hypothetical protein [Phenylobacterium sp.]
MKAQALASSAGYARDPRLTLLTSAPASTGGCPASPVSTTKPLPGRSFAARLAYSPSSTARATIPSEVRTVSTAPTAPARDKSIADRAITATFAPAVSGGWEPSSTPCAHDNRDSAYRKQNLYPDEDTATAATTTSTVACSPTPTPAPHDEVVHAHAAPASAPRASQALQARRGDEAGRADQSRRAAHQ